MRWLRNKSSLAIVRMNALRDARGKRGFTLVETMMALVILVMMTGIVAMGVPVAWRTYTQAVNGSDAQVLMSSTLSELRSELGMAQQVVVKTTEGGTEKYSVNANGELVYYVSGDGYWAKLESIPAPDANSRAYVARRLFINDNLIIDDPANAKTEIESGSNAELGKEPLGAANAVAALNVSFDSITLQNGVFEVAGVKVTDSEGHELASQDTYYIQALMLQGNED